MPDLHGKKLSMVERLGSSSSSELLRSVYIRRVALSDRTRQKFAKWNLLILSMSLFSLVGVIRYLMTSAKPVIFLSRSALFPYIIIFYYWTLLPQRTFFLEKRPSVRVYLFAISIAVKCLIEQLLKKKNCEKHTKCSSSATFVNSQLVSCLPVGISHAVFIYNLLQSWSLN